MEIVTGDMAAVMVVQEVMGVVHSTGVMAVVQCMVVWVMVACKIDSQACKTE